MAHTGSHVMQVMQCGCGIFGHLSAIVLEKREITLKLSH